MSSKPPFRADHVGSLVRPVRLREARESYLGGELDRDELIAVEDACVAEAVAMQQRVGIGSITDGEFRRTSFREAYFEKVEGFSRDRLETDFEFRYADGSKRRATPVPRVVGKLKRSSSIVADEFATLKNVTDGVAKICLPAPSVVHWFSGDRVLAEGPYGNCQGMMEDIAEVIREELDELSSLGCTYVQLDEVAIPIMCDPNVQRIISDRGEDYMALVDLYVDTINAAIRGRSPELHVCIHMCRGNEGVAGMGSGGYAAIAERVFQRAEVDGYLLEYDTPRAGDFEPLRFIPDGVQIGLGLVSTKIRDLESPDEIKRRVDAAARFAKFEDLSLCPQCGFASAFRYDRFSLEDEERKLAHVVELANQIWH